MREKLRCLWDMSRQGKGEGVLKKCEFGQCIYKNFLKNYK